MSLLRNNARAKSCECHTGGVSDSGLVALQLLPIPRETAAKVKPDIAKAQLEVARDAQNQYLPHLQEAATNFHLGSHHAHLAPVGNLAELPQIMNDAKLTIRVNHMKHGIDEQAQCAELNANALNDLLNSGRVSLESPAGGTFELFSNDHKTIDHVQFRP